jgi:DNA-binding SARP family transcriptional activator
MAKMRINLLGGLELAWSDRAGAVSLPRKAKALVAYLASHAGQPQSREKLADLLWGESGEKHARMSLRQALRTIRKALPAGRSDWLVAADDQIALELSDIEVDVLRFESLATQHDPAVLEDAARIYAGDFLDGFSIKEDNFETWVRGERDRLRGLAIEALRRLVGHYADTQDWERSIQAAQRLLLLEPIQEDVHRALMRAYGAQGRKDMALKQFELCRECLQRELGIQPARETQQMLVAIRLGRTALRQSPKPQILVLPFTAISHGPEEQELAAGLAEHVLTALSKLGWLSVAAHRSGPASASQGTNAVEAARQHGADFALEGSLQRAAGRLRIMVQLIDVTSSGHLWAERFDHEIGDVLDLEDEVTQKIAAASEQVLANAVADAAARGAGPQIDEKAGIRKANRLMRRIDRDDLGRAIALLRDITAARPDSKGAHQVRCFCHVLNVAACWSLEPARDVAEALVTASKSLELASGDFLSHTVMAYASIYARRFDQAIA